MQGKSSNGTPSISATTEFFDAVLPGDGYYCLWAMDGDRKPTFWFDDTYAMAEKAIALSEAGAEVYYAVASFKNRSVRQEQNVLSHAALKLDLDVKPGGYSCQEDAVAAAKAFCKDTGLPNPIMVSSGYGLHIYLLLAEDAPTAHWKSLSNALVDVAIQSGLRLDASVCKTAAGVLRPIGTFNYKRDEPSPVEYIGRPCFDRYPLSAFDCLGAAKVSTSLGVIPEHLRGLGTELTTKGITPTEPSDPLEIRNRCGQIKRLYESDGNLPYEPWRASVALLAWATDGDELAHVWSEGHPSYEERETQQKLDDSRKASGPITCAHFMGLDVPAESPCTTCPFKTLVKTPLELGRAPFVKRAEQPADAPPPDGIELYGEICPRPPQGYSLSERGVKTAGTQEEPMGKEVSPYPLYLDKISSDPTAQAGYALTFRAYHPQEGWRSVPVSAAELGKGAPGAMLDRGVVVSQQLFMKYTTKAAAELQSRRKTEHMFPCYGWKGDSFLVGERLYTNGVPVAAPVSGEAANRKRLLTIQGEGEKWKDAVERLFAKGCEVQSFAVLCAFAAPLMRFADAVDGGAILALVSRESAKGKSLAMLAGQTIWGAPEALVISNSATENSRPIIYGALGSLPIFWDEATQKDPSAARTRVEDFTLGRGKDRANREGGLQQTTYNWRTVLISGSNSSLVDSLSAGTGSDAMAYRVFELTAELPPTVDTSKGEGLKRVMIANAGHGGDAFLRYLTQPHVIEAVRQRVAYEVEQLQVQHGFGDSYRYWRRLIACAYVAGLIVQKLNILEIETKRIIDWAIDKAKAEIERRKEEAVYSFDDCLAEYLNEQGMNVITVQVAHKRHLTQTPRVTPRGAVVGRYELDSKTLYVAAPAFNKWLAERDYGAREVINHLAASGVLKGRAKITLGAGTSYASMQSNVYKFEIDWDPPEEEEEPSNVVRMRR